MAVLDRKWSKQFSQGCTDIAIYFEHLERINSFRLNVPLLVTGATGSGKTYFAEFLHKMTMPESATFERVNLAQLSGDQDTFKSTLEGHTKNAFTGATHATQGLFETCQKGTIFFDELDGLSLQNQIQMLTHMDNDKGDGTMQIRKLGDSRSVEIARPNMVFATNRPILQALEEGKLRPDFVFRCRDSVDFSDLQRLFDKDPERLSVYLLFFILKVMGPLDEKHFEKHLKLRVSGELLSKKSDLCRRMVNFSWPGNFRTFEKYCRHLVDRRRSDNECIGLPSTNGGTNTQAWDDWSSRQYPDFTANATIPQIAHVEPVKVNFPRHFSADESERPAMNEIRCLYYQIIKKALTLSESGGADGVGRVAGAAHLLGIDQRTLKAKIEEFNKVGDLGRL